MGTHGAHREEQAEVVEPQAACRQQGGLPPFLAEHGPDEVALLEQPLGQAGDRGPLADEAVAYRLGPPPRVEQGAVHGHHPGTEPHEEDEADGADDGRVDQPRVDRRPEEHRGQDEHREGQEPADAEERRRR